MALHDLISPVSTETPILYRREPIENECAKKKKIPICDLKTQRVYGKTIEPESPQPLPPNHPLSGKCSEPPPPRSSKLFDHDS